MNKLLAIIFCLFSYFSFGQAFTAPRSSAAITVQDSRLRALFNFYLPHQHGLSLNGGLDTLGMIIYEDSSGHAWYRDTILTGGHRWDMFLNEADLPLLAAQTFPGNVTGSATRSATALPIVIFNIEYFGAVPDSNITDNTTAIQNTIDTAAKYGGIVYIPARPLPFGFTQTLHIDVGKPVHFMGMVGPTLTYTASFVTTTSAGGSRLIYNSLTGRAISNKANGSIFNDFNIKCGFPTATASTNFGLYLDSANTCVVNNVWSENFNQDFVVANGVQYKFENCYAIEPHLYGYHVSGYPGIDAGDGRFTKCFSFPTDVNWAFTDTCFEYDNAGGIHIDDCKLGGSVVGINSNFQGFTDFEIKGTSIEAILSTSIRIAVAPGASLSNLQIVNNQMTFLGNRGIDLDATALGSSIQGGIIAGNIIAARLGLDTGIYIHGNVSNLIVGPQNCLACSSPVVNASIGTPAPSVDVVSQQQPLTPAPHVFADLHFGNFMIYTASSTDTISIVNSGAGNHFVLAVLTAVPGSNLILGNGSNYAQIGGTPNVVYLNPTVNGVTIIQGVTSEGNQMVVTNVGNNGWLSGSVPFWGSGNTLTQDLANFNYDDVHHQLFLNGLGINTTNAGMAGQFEIYQNTVSPVYVDLLRWPTGAHFINRGMKSTTQAYYVVDGQATSPFAVLQDAAGNMTIPGSVGTGGVIADPSAVFSATSTTQGAMLPRMTTTQKLAIATPAEGLEVYDLTLHQKSYFNGSTWVNL